MMLSCGPQHTTLSIYFDFTMRLEVPFSGANGKHSITILISVMGKAEGSVQQEEWHGHVTAVTVAPEYRRLGLAAKLISNLEEISEK